MNTVISPDGPTIAYDKLGHGPAVIPVAGAFGSRTFWSGPELAKLLASCFTVYNYDQRGRSESGDTKPYAVAREIEDMEALIDEVGLAVWHFLRSCPASGRTARHESQEAGHVRVACPLSGPFGCRAQGIASTLLGSV